MRPRRGLTLFELLLALAIFLAALAALSQLIAAGTRAAVQGQLQTEAVFRCQTKLAEIAAGAQPLEPATAEPFEDDRQWTWSVNVDSGPWPELELVEVTVAHAGENALGNVSYSLRRYVRDPRLADLEDAVRPAPLAPPAPPPQGEPVPAADNAKDNDA